VKIEKIRLVLGAEKNAKNGFGQKVKKKLILVFRGPRIEKTGVGEKIKGLEKVWGSKSLADEKI
jgi:hypothetical protein